MSIFGVRTGLCLAFCVLAGANNLSRAEDQLAMSARKGTMQSIRIETEGNGIPAVLPSMLGVRISERCPVEVNTGGTPDLVIALTYDSRIGNEGFRIEDAGPGHIRIAGDGNLGLLAGIGRFLRESRYGQDGFEPGAWRGTSIPEKPVRGIYFASHFYNYYQEAPLAEVERYVEDLGLWGFNTLHVWFDMHHFKGIQDPAAQSMLARLRVLHSAARRIGMRIGLCVLGNEAYADSPPELRAEINELWAFGVELCPAKPGAADLMLKWFDEEFQAFADLKLDSLSIGPYDQGGCTCEKCRPWGGNGFLDMARKIAQVFRNHSPHGKVILVTWLFDHEHHRFKGDWAGLAQRLAGDSSWADYILAGTHDQRLPAYLQSNPVPGGLPLVGFPEISMRGMCPWGGFGANPMPRHLAQLWAEWGGRVEGGFPYSEGLYEDMNKAIMAQLYWRGQAPEETLRQYIAYEFGPPVEEDVLKAIHILEANQHRVWEGGDFKFPHTRLILPPDSGAAAAKALLQGVDTALPESARRGWRWQVLLLRALIDDELFRNNGVVTPACEPYFEELTRLYHAEKAEFLVHPPVSRVR